MRRIRCLIARPLERLAHATRHEAPDNEFTARPQWPDHGSAGPVRFGDQGLVGNIDPVILKADSIVAAVRFPINIADSNAVRERTTQPLAGFECVEPSVEFGTA